MATYALLFVNDEAFRDRPADEVAAIYAEITRWSDDLERKGILKRGTGELQEKRTAITVRRGNGGMGGFDGPFMESKEHVRGISMIQVPQFDEAIPIPKGFPG